MKFKDHKKTITSPFADKSSYRKWTHTGIDWIVGYGNDVWTDNPGRVYKVYDEDNPGSLGWRAVYLLVENGDEYMEVVLGHCKDIFVSPGEAVKEDEVIGTEGNFGLVYQGGKQITPEMRKNGSKKGSHVHEAYRPVIPVPDRTDGKHYLRRANGRYYRDADGNYYEIKHTNETKGYVDPMKYSVAKRLSLRLILLKLRLKIMKLLQNKTD